MGDLDIGMAMVAARIASSETGREQNVTKTGPDKKRPSLSGVKMEAIEGDLLLIPSVESQRYIRLARGWTMTRKDGSIVRLDTGEIVQPPKNK